MAMTSEQFIAAVKKIAGCKTIYAKGGIATYVNKSDISSLQKMYKSWYTASKVAARFEPIYDKGYFAFDCCGLIKAAIWGFNGKKAFRATDGYETNGLPDFPVNTVADGKAIAALSSDWKSIVPGEILFTPGHIGVYIGDGLGIECTTAWGNNVQYTVVGNIDHHDGYPERSWKYHGKLKCIDYEERKEVITVSLPLLQKGDKVGEVKTLQRILSALGAKDQNGALIAVDGSYGAKTKFAVENFQLEKKIAVTGVCDKNTWEVLLRG